ncbi:hypothetical protein TNCT_696941, partial [Trichonephila clavata]
IEIRIIAASFLACKLIHI